MQIVIDIPDDIYKCAKDDLMRAPLIIVRAIAQGIPLTEHHGDLIDRNKLIEQYGLENATKYGNKNAEQQRYSYSTMMMYEIADMIDDAETIIPATKEGAE